MAGWHGGGTIMSRSSSACSCRDDRDDGPRTFTEGVKRPLDTLLFVDLTEQIRSFPPAKRLRYTGINNDAGVTNLNRPLRPSFFVIRETENRSHSPEYERHEADSPLPLPSPSSDETPGQEARCYSHGVALYSTCMERTPSGHFISSEDANDESAMTEPGMVDDGRASRQVDEHFRNFRNRVRHSKIERILKTLICPNPRGPDFEIDNAALESIFYAANELFFYGCLNGRVRWDWSDNSSSRYHRRVLGTTALRAAKDGGYETLIVLSQPLLRNNQYNRRLLISTFLHELIHSYLFVRCGPKARYCGGHTEGFQRIAKLIDKWAGRDTLFLTNMEADLGHFKRNPSATDHHDVYNHCHVRWPGDTTGVRAKSECRLPTIR